LKARTAGRLASVTRDRLGSLFQLTVRIKNCPTVTLPAFRRGSPSAGSGAANSIDSLDSGAWSATADGGGVAGVSGRRRTGGTDGAASGTEAGAPPLPAVAWPVDAASGLAGLVLAGAGLVDAGGAIRSASNEVICWVSGKLAVVRLFMVGSAWVPRVALNSRPRAYARCPWWSLLRSAKTLRR